MYVASFFNGVAGVWLSCLAKNLISVLSLSYVCLVFATPVKINAIKTFEH